MQVYFAPLESITGYVFRNVFEEYYGGIDRYFTPFITATDSRRLRNKEMRDILPENQYNRGVPLVPQVPIPPRPAQKQVSQNSMPIIQKETFSSR